MIVEGSRVKLKPDEIEGWTEQIGTALDVAENGCAMIELDKEFWEPGERDGLREVPVEQLEEI